MKTRPKFHGREKAGTENYAISAQVLSWLHENIPPKAHTLETGCGYSTILFALRSMRHAVISPFEEEHEQIRTWCFKHRVDITHIDFYAECSQNKLPILMRQTSRNLDMVLIDGDHAFPAPFIDWYFTADCLKQGGILIVDDTQLITGKILRDFLKAESDRWLCIEEIDKTSIFEKKVSTNVTSGIPWTR